MAGEDEQATLAAAIERDHTRSKLAELIRPHVKEGTERQVAQLLHGGFALEVDHDGFPKLVSRDGRPAGDVVRERLGSAEFAHFIRPDPNSHEAAVSRMQLALAKARGGGGSPAPGLAGTYGGTRPLGG
jgi:hypothetical protein